MNLVEQILEQLIEERGQRSIHFENAKLYRLGYQVKKLRVVDTVGMRAVVNQFPVRDTVVVHLIIDEDNIDTHRLPDQMDDLVKDLTSKSTRYQEIKVDIDKAIEGGCLSIYDSPALCDHLKHGSFKSRLELFDQLLLNKVYLIFQLTNITEEEFESHSFYFTHSGRASTNPVNRTKRKKIVGQRNEITHFSGSTHLQLIPEDFAVSKPSGNCLKKLFDELNLILLVSSLFDFTDGNEMVLDYKLGGYITLKGQATDLDISDETRAQYDQIFNWTYEEGNLSDKAGLVRNILSLNLKELPKLELAPHTFDSIRSAYKLYLKQNIKQYIEIRNKVSDQLMDFNKRATQIIDNFGAGFQKSALAVVTFFASIIVTKILSGKAVEDTFTYDAFYLTLLFILISAGYLFLSYKEVSSQRDRFNENYLQVKKRYEDLLTKEDINKILGDDAEHTSNKTYLTTKRNYYLGLWIIVLVLILATTCWLHYLYVRDTPVAGGEFFIRPIDKK